MTEQTKNFKVVNKPVTKLDAMGLACGRAEFTDDVNFDNMLYAKALWSPHANALIKNIDTTQAEKVKGVKAVLTYKNLKSNRHTTAGQGYPEPSPYDTLVLDQRVRYVGDRVALVAAETLQAAEEAVSKIKVEYEVYEPVFEIMDAMKKGAPIVHEEKDSKNIPDAKRNICAQFELDIPEGRWFEEADIIIEHEYTTQWAQHCALEPHTTISYFDANGRLTLRTSTQVPFHVRRVVAYALDIPIQNIRVIKPRIGGGFGSKQEILLEPMCAALTIATGRPVRFELTRREVFVSSRTRHPSLTKLKTGIKKDGTITDLDLAIYLNNGAYGAHALTVMMCAGSHTMPMYQAKNNKFTGRTVYTNLPVAGAYRGYGATQAFFALESQMDMMAEALDMDPIELRLKNYIKQGETSPIFRAMGEGGEGVDQIMTSCALEECIKKGVKEFGWYERKERNKNQAGPKFRGLGCACSMQGSGIPEVDMAAVTIKMNEDGSFNLTCGATDIGTGSDTVLAQIAAEVLTVPSSKIIVYSSDTDLTPFDVGAYASSTTFISGNASRKCAEKVKTMIIAVGAQILGEPDTDLYLEDAKVVSRKTGASCPFREIGFTSYYYKNQHQIIASASNTAHTSPPPFAATFCEVEVDTQTGQVKVLDFYTAVDCGTAINPQLAKGQIEGATMNALSYALTEELEFNAKGYPLNPSFGLYKIYNAADAPKMTSVIIPTYEPDGPFGAKSVSEIGINGPIPGIANAIYDAVGVRLFHPPFTAEKVLAAIKEKNARCNNG